ncbi:unnamed protein product [Rotaria sp. Silwood2]|nr:unnamed protein product [Rotaria sp. Silwood2]CAF2672798.1 unnamed protein product [Rotaria sp. Silwood2]CAF3079554.1 unnamed protein product [Rotaria sp. Silwood2]CAF4132527.1 unnamed protein product [Rotaria sp. Silwood2]CAF4416452.1 unnamed protein product [Rotaria sp. Silwood2]
MKFYAFVILLFLYSSSICLTNDDNKQCLIRDSCSNLTLKSPSIYDDEPFIQHRNCFCDSICEEYDDCCHQLKLSNANNYECIDFLSPTFNDSLPPFSPLFVWMRAKCLSIYIGSRSDIQCRNLKNQTFLDNPLLFIPVTSKQTNITYRNYYCAYCNNDANINLQFWEYKANCHGNGSLSDYMVLDKEEQVNYYIHNLTQQCKKTIIYPRVTSTGEPSVFIRPCKKSLPSTCPSQTSADLAGNCSLSSTAYRYDIISHVVYRNPYCAECNNINSSNITCTDPDLRSSISLTHQTRAPSLSILFDPNLLERYLNYDLDKSSTMQMIYSLYYKCSKPNELYNLFLKKCSQITNSSKEIIISMNCSSAIQISEDYTRYNNGSLYIINQPILLNRDQYVFINDHQIVFCANQWKENQLTFSFYRNILTIICTSISLTCLVIFVIAFWLISTLHNLPGKCLLFLSISIFIGQLLFISTSVLTQYSYLCLISAILIHYFYLSSFFWLLIIAIHIHATFNCEIVRREKLDKDRYRLLAYNILVWCSTGIIILIACLLQFTNPESKFSPNYGYLFCLISKPNAMILFFLVPIGCLLLIIAILFIKTILAIHHSQRIAQIASASSSSSVSNHSNNTHLFIYTRLASLMGLQWTLLIIALIIQQTWSWIIFEITNSLPGVFICFGFLFSQRLWNNIKQRIMTKLIIRRQSSRSNTTSTTLMQPPSQRS